MNCVTTDLKKDFVANMYNICDRKLLGDYSFDSFFSRV